MLLSFVGVDIKQGQIVQATSIEKKIFKHGMTVEEMSQATSYLAPDYCLWFKRESSIIDLIKIINIFKFPAGVEWQGVFEDINPDADDDPGHYSVVTKLDLKKKMIFLADPYRLYAGKDRQLSILRFERRWWDINEIVDPRTEKKKEMDDYHMIFVVTPKNATFPKELGMRTKS